MFKKLLSIATVAVIAFAAKANEQIYMLDYSTLSNFPFYVMGYEPQIVDGVMVSENPMSVNEDTGEITPSWYQYFIADGINTEPGKTYEVTVKAKASENCEFNLMMLWSWAEGGSMYSTLNLGTDWSEVKVVYENVGGESCALIAQPGASLAKIEWAWVKVDEVSDTVVTWEDILTNGDAEGEFAEVPCAFGKVYPGFPEPAAIEEIDGNHVFVLHATEMAENPWDNQFWIMAPQTFEVGDVYKVSFKCKADKEASIGTQSHAAPGEYLHWEAIGTVQFSTEWKAYEMKVTVKSSMNGMQSIAFNINDFVDANVYYFDDIKWEVRKTSGVQNISIDNDENAPAEYYTINGVRVNNPTQGLYIVKQGNKVSKVIIK